MNKILIAEDEPSIREMVRLCLKKNGYSCRVAENGMQAAELAEREHFDLALLDIMLPDYDGFELIEYMRQYGIPVIFVTARTAVADRVKGLRAGAEDYISKPFDLTELCARVETVLRRFHKTEQVLEAGDIRVDTLSHTVTCGGVAVALPAKEYDLLIYFIRNAGIALYRENIYENVWQEPYLGNTRTVDLHVQRLKKRLGLSEAIETVYKIGYRFVL